MAPARPAEEIRWPIARVKTGEADVMHAVPTACCAPEAKPTEAKPAEKTSGGCCG